MSKRLNNLHRATVSVGALVASCGLAQAQYSTNFEAPLYTSSVGQGVLLTNGIGGGGQDGWYVPSVGGRDGYVMTFAGNTWNVVAHPAVGNNQCQVNSPSAPLFGRSQHAINFGAGGVWEASWDNYGRYNGTLPASDNLGSFSLQDSTLAKYFQQLMTWGATAVGPAPNATNYTATADKYHIAYGVFQVGGGAIEFKTPGSEWRDIPVDHWVRCTVRWTFDNPPRVLRCSIRDLTANGPEIVRYIGGCDWYLAGGATSGLPLPTDFRLFAGGGGAGTETQGNVTAWDNISIQPSTIGSGACCAPNGGCSFVDQSTCCNSGGIYRGDTITCAAANCPPPGACCLPDGSCISTVATTCAAQNGQFRGDNTVCGPAANCIVFGYTETNDVGGLPNDAQTVAGNGQLTKIIGTMDLDDADMYRIQICNRTTFTATTAPSGADTQLWLFRLNGTGVTHDDDTSASNAAALITGQFVTTNDDYYMSITMFNRDAADVNGGEIWLDGGAAGNPPAFPERAPDGPGAANPITQYIRATAPGGQYVITLTGACFVGTPATCYANCDLSTGTPKLTGNDFVCFINAYANNLPYANCDLSTGTPLLTGNDFVCFINAYAQGCT